MTNQISDKQLGHLDARERPVTRGELIDLLTVVDHAVLALGSYAASKNASPEEQSDAYLDVTEAIRQFHQDLVAFASAG